MFCVFSSASFDRSVRVWDVEKLTSVCTFVFMYVEHLLSTQFPKKLNNEILCTFSQHEDTIYSMEWNKNGSMLGTTSKDKQIRIFDPRSDENVSKTDGFGGSKSSHCFFVDNFNWIGATNVSHSLEFYTL